MRMAGRRLQQFRMAALSVMPVSLQETREISIRRGGTRPS